MADSRQVAVLESLSTISGLENFRRLCTVWSVSSASSLDYFFPGSDESVPILRTEAPGILKNLGFDDRGLEAGLASSQWWLAARDYLGKRIDLEKAKLKTSDEEFAISQPDEAKLEAWAKEHDAEVQKLMATGKTRQQAITELSAMMARGEGKMASEQVRGGDKGVIRQISREAPAPQKIVREEKAPVGGLSKQTEKVIEERGKMAERRGYTWKREPFQKFYAVTVGGFREYLQRQFGGGETPEPLPGATGFAYEQMAPRQPLNLFKSLQKRFGMGEFAENKVAGAATKEATKTGTKVAKGKAIEAALALLPTGASQAALVLKKAIDVASKLIPAPVKKFLQDVWSKVKVGVAALGAYLFLVHPFATAAALLGFAFFGPAGFVGGLILGLGAEWVLGTVSGVGTAISSGTAALGGAVFGAVQTAGTVIGGFMTGALGVTGAVGGGLIVAGTIGGVLVVSLFTAIFVIGGAMAEQPNANNQGQTRKDVFRVAKTADPSSIPNYDGKTAVTINYTITITAGDNPMVIDSITDELTRTKAVADNWKVTENLTLPSGQLAPGQSYSPPYSYTVSGLEFKDSSLVNTLTVEGHNATTNEKQTQKVSFAVIIGNPPMQQPYGFPAIGMVTSLDDKDGHYSCFLLPGFGCYGGGIDIALAGGADVKSTLDGQVVDAKWNDEVGGVVYIQSCLVGQKPPNCNGSYIAEFEHLENSVASIKKGSFVSRGQFLARTYVGKLPATHCSPSTPPDKCHPEHVHYQILLNGGNDFFGNKNNAGKCSEGKIEPSPPPYIGMQISTPGPFVCQ